MNERSVAAYEAAFFAKREAEAAEARVVLLHRKERDRARDAGSPTAYQRARSANPWLAGTDVSADDSEAGATTYEAERPVTLDLEVGGGTCGAGTGFAKPVTLTLPHSATDASAAGLSYASDQRVARLVEGERAIEVDDAAVGAGVAAGERRGCHRMLSMAAGGQANTSAEAEAEGILLDGVHEGAVAAGGNDLRATSCDRVTLLRAKAAEAAAVLEKQKKLTLDAEQRRDELKWQCEAAKAKAKMALARYGSAQQVYSQYERKLRALEDGRQQKWSGVFARSGGSATCACWSGEVKRPASGALKRGVAAGGAGAAEAAAAAKFTNKLKAGAKDKRGGTMLATGVTMLRG